MDLAPDRAMTGARSAASLAALARGAALLVPVALPVAVTPWGVDGYSHVKALVLYALAALAAAGWLLSRLASRPAPWRETPAELAAWGYLLAVMAATVVSGYPRLSIFGAPGRHEGLFVLAAYVTLYMVGVHLLGSRRGVEAVLTAAVGAAVAVTGYGLLQPFVPPLFAGEEFLREWYSRGSLPRISSTVGGPVIFGGYLAFMLPVFVSMCARSGVIRRGLWLAAAAGTVVALALTLTRAAWVGAAAGLFVFGLAGWRSIPGRRVIAAVLLLTAVGAGGLLLSIGRPGEVVSRVAATATAQSGSVAQRVYTWQGTLSLIRSRPLLGWGPETLGEVFPYDRPSLVRYFGFRPVIINRAHNDVLHVAVSVGIPGAAAYVLFWILVMAGAWRRRTVLEGSDRILAAGWAGALVAYLVQVQFSFSTPAVTPTVWLLAGAVSGWLGETGARG